MAEFQSVPELVSPRKDQLSNTGENSSTVSTESNSDLDKSKTSFSEGLMAQLLHENAALARRLDEIEKKLSSQSNHLDAEISSTLAQRVNDLESDVSMAIRDLLNFRRHLDFQINETCSRQDAELKKVNISVHKLTFLMKQAFAIDHLTSTVRCTEAPPQQDVPRSCSTDQVGMRCAPGLGSPALRSRDLHPVQKGNHFPTAAGPLQKRMEGRGSGGMVASSPCIVARECEAQLGEYPRLAQVGMRCETRDIEQSSSMTTSRYDMDEHGLLKGEAGMLDRMIDHSKATLGKIRMMVQNQPIAKQSQGLERTASPLRPNLGASTYELHSRQSGSCTLPVGARVIRNGSVPTNFFP